MDFVGTSGRDNYLGTIDADEFDMTQGGRDTVSGLEGEDVFLFGTELNANDEIDGGDDFDSVVLDGNYLGGITFLPTTMINVEEIVLTAGHDYSLTLDDATNPFVMTIDGSALGAGDALAVDATAETSGTFQFYGGAGDDLFTVSFRGTYHLETGGADTAIGGSSTDSFFMGDAFDAGDSLVGGGGVVDGVRLEGDYSAGLTITGSMLSETEIINLFALWSGSFVLEDGVVAAGMTVRPTVASFGYAPGESISFDGSQETDGFWWMTGGVSDDTFTGGALADILDFLTPTSGGQDGTDIARGGGGDDVIRFDVHFTRSDQVDGGAGFDELTLEGDLSAEVNFSSTTMRDVEQVVLTAGFDYALTVGNNNVQADGFTVLGDGLLAGDTLTYDGSAESVSDVVITGGAGEDTIATGGGDDSLDGNGGGDSLTGGDGDDTINGAQGRDTIEGGEGTDRMRGGLAPNTFVFTAVSESTGAGRDYVDVLKPLKDHFDLDVAVAAVDARVNAGALSEASFDANLAAAIGAGQLGAGNAVVFQPNAGGLAGRFFLVVDANGVAGYQAGDDYVMEFAAGSQPNSIAAGFFI